MNNSRNKGFTLAELLIVVAIIAVLVAVAIPVFTAQLNKAKYAADVANARAIYAELSADFIGNGISTVNIGKNGGSASTGGLLEFDGGDPYTIEIYDKDGNLQNKYSFTGIADYLEIYFNTTESVAPGVDIYRTSERTVEAGGSEWGNQDNL